VAKIFLSAHQKDAGEEKNNPDLGFPLERNGTTGPPPFGQDTQRDNLSPFMFSAPNTLLIKYNRFSTVFPDCLTKVMI
jgi:hypothetical protein